MSLEESERTITSTKKSNERDERDERDERNESNDSNDSNKCTKTLDDYILDLKIISKIKPNYKLSIINDKISIDTNSLQSLTRYFSSYSRGDTIEYLENLDKQLLIHIEKLINTKDSELNLMFNSRSNILVTLTYDLKLGILGLNNLINTYQKDELIVSKLEIIINNFNLKIQKISEVLKL